MPITAWVLRNEIQGFGFGSQILSSAIDPDVHGLRLQLKIVPYYIDD